MAVSMRKIQNKGTGKFLAYDGKLIQADQGLPGKADDWQLDPCGVADTYYMKNLRTGKFLAAGGAGELYLSESKDAPDKQWQWQLQYLDDSKTLCFIVNPQYPTQPLSAWWSDPKNPASNSTVSLFPNENKANQWWTVASGAVSVGLFSGPILAWGRNNVGESGNSDTAVKKFPVKVGDDKLTNIASLASQYNSGAVTLGDGTVRTWGYNAWGQIGDGTIKNALSPVEPLQLPRMKAIPGMKAIDIHCHTLAVSDDGSIRAWGYNGMGQIGDTSAGDSVTVRRTTIHSTGMADPIRAVSVGVHHSLALDNDGNVWAWGSNEVSQLGHNEKTTDRPVKVAGPPGMGKITAISAGWKFSLALDEDETVWAWGYGGWYELGNGKTDGVSSVTPARVKGVNGNGDLTKVTAISAGYGHALAVANGSVVAWGSNEFSQCGISGAGWHATPQQVVGVGVDEKTLTGVTALAAGYYHSLALMEDGTVTAWGNNGSGQLGDGTTTNRFRPARVLEENSKKPLTGVKLIAAGEYHSVAVCG